jgi:ubiquinone biosynthesis protein COQ4
LTIALRVPDPPPRAPLRWRRAWRSLRALLADSDDTAKAIDLSYAIGQSDFERTFQRFLATPSGLRLIERRPALADALAERPELERMAPGSLGRAYLDYLDRNGYSATGLLALERGVRERWEREEGSTALDPLRAWFRDRFMLSHDLFHVVTDYGTDDVGEATLLAFSLAQNGGRANALLTAGAVFEVWHALGLRWLRYAFRAWRRGRNAASLAALPWEELLPLPLEAVRELAALPPSALAHPGGIWSAKLGARGAA